MSKIFDDDFDESSMFSKPTDVETIEVSQQPKPAPKPMSASPNPLAKYFREPGLHVVLPTRGVFFSENAYEETLGGDIPVFPMRAADEMLLKSPDALMSGYALEKLIESCVPAIKEPRKVSVCDLDVLLLAIRSASYGELMEMEAKCPNSECGKTNEFAISLPSMLDDMTYVDRDNPVRINDDIVVYIRPYSLENATKLALAAFHESRKVQMSEIQELDDKDKTDILNKSYSAITKINMSTLAECVIKVVSPEGETTNPLYISEFIHNIPRDQVKKIDKNLREINERGLNKKMPVKCQHCEHEWTTEIELNPANFFDPAS